MAVCTFFFCFVFSFGAEYVLVDSCFKKTISGRQFNFSYCSSLWKINFFKKKNLNVLPMHERKTTSIT